MSAPALPMPTTDTEKGVVSSSPIRWIPRFNASNLRLASFASAEIEAAAVILFFFVAIVFGEADFLVAAFFLWNRCFCYC